MTPPPEPDLLSPGVGMSATGFVDELKFQEYVLDTIRNASEPQELIFTHVKSSWGECIVDLINETADGLSTRKTYNSLTNVLRINIMPTEIHDCGQTWWRLSELNLHETGDLTTFEQEQMEVLVGTTLQFPSGPYITSRKEPDLFVRCSSDILPSFAIECGWSESWNHLLNDMNLLLVGGDGDVRAVVLLKWRLKRGTGQVSGFVELYVRDRNGMPICRQREEVFPQPTGTTTPQVIELSRKEMFGCGLIADPTRTGPPSPMIQLKIDDLRAVALRALNRMNLSPA